MRPVLKTLLNNTLRARAIRACGGSLPDYYFDFVNNRALIAGRDIGPISNTPSLTGTLDLTPSGHLVDGADNGLIIPLTGVTYPLTMLLECVRTTDSGGTENVVRLDDGDATDRVGFNVTNTDILRWTVTTASVSQANIDASGTLVLGQVNRAVGCTNTNRAQAARTNGTLGTEDTAVTLPANPTRLVIGVDSAGAHTFTGYIRELAIVSNITSTDGQLVASALAA